MFILADEKFLECCHFGWTPAIIYHNENQAGSSHRCNSSIVLSPGGDKLTGYLWIIHFW